MKKDGVRILFWTPRILGVLFAIFISLFALDVFGEGRSPWETFVALAFHLVPTALILLALAIAWKRALPGGILFLLLGTIYLGMTWGRFEWPALVLLSGLPFLLGALFLLDWSRRREREAHH